MYKDDIGYFLNRYKAGEAKKYLQQAIPLLIDVGIMMKLLTSLTKQLRG